MAKQISSAYEGSGAYAYSLQTNVLFNSIEVGDLYEQLSV